MMNNKHFSKELKRLAKENLGKSVKRGKSLNDSFQPI